MTATNSPLSVSSTTETKNRRCSGSKRPVEHLLPINFGQIELLLRADAHACPGQRGDAVDAHHVHILDQPGGSSHARSARSLAAADFAVLLGAEV
eukprot:9471676-Pyramimonas_sp.AAC.1